MCGIAGWIENGCRMVERGKTLKAISETLERRGPDENGTYINGDTALTAAWWSLTAKTASSPCRRATGTSPM